MFIRVLIILFAITSTPVFAIINGKAADHTKLSFFVQIMEVYKTERQGVDGLKAVHVCGGSILNNQYILTAAHCVDNPSDYITKYVSIGEPSKTQHSIHTLKEIEKIHIFEKYGYEIKKGEKYLVNDLAILKLKNPITENVASITFPSESYIHSYYEYVIAIGLGRIESPNPKKYLYGNVSQYLRYTEIELMHIEICDELNVPSSLLCSRNDFNDTGIIKKTAQGDSGGPVLIYDKETKEYQQVGITSSHDIDYNRTLSLSYYHNITKPESVAFIRKFENLAEKTTYNPDQEIIYDPNDENYYFKKEYENPNSFWAAYNVKVDAFNKEIEAKREIYYASDQYKYDLFLLVCKVFISIALILAFFTLFALIIKTIIDEDDFDYERENRIY